MVTEANENMTHAQKALLFDHQHLGHTHMAHLDMPPGATSQGKSCLCPAVHQVAPAFPLSAWPAKLLKLEANLLV